MSERIGTPRGAALGSPTVKSNDTDKKGVAYSYQMIGGCIPVLNQTDRNALPVDTKLNEDGYSSGQRELGMIVYYMKASTLTFYQLRIPTWDTLNTAQKIAALGDNNNWIQVTFAGGGHSILDETTPVIQRSKLAFVGTAVTVTDDAVSDKTIVTINASSITVDAAPTNGSSNAVSSDGVYDALASKVETSTYNSFVSDTATNFDSKVSIIAGKGLSENDYTDTDKDKVANLSGTNTGDETTATIKTKLGAATTSVDGYMTSAQATQLGTNTSNIASNTSAIASNTSAIATNTTDIAGKADKGLTINTPTASYTLVLADAGGMVDMDVASANTVTIPPYTSVAFPYGRGSGSTKATQIIIGQNNVGQTTLVAGSGVTFQGFGSQYKLAGQYAGATLIHMAQNVWRIMGNTTT